MYMTSIQIHLPHNYDLHRRNEPSINLEQFSLFLKTKFILYHCLLISKHLLRCNLFFKKHKQLMAVLSKQIFKKNSQLKLRCNERLTHMFIACSCVFRVRNCTTLLFAVNRKVSIENSTQCNRTSAVQVQTLFKAQRYIGLTVL